MPAYSNRLRSFVRRNPGTALLPPAWDRVRLREYFNRSLSHALAQGANGTVELWDHQVDTVTATRDRFQDLSRPASGVAVLPTGGGKTEIFEFLVNAVSRLTPDGKRVTPNTLVLVPTRQLVAQTARRFVASYPHLSSVIGVLGVDLPPDVDDIHGVRPVTIATYDWFVRSVISGSLAVEDVHMLIMDEAHRALSDLRQDVFKPFIDECISIAFSATPSFDEAKSLYELLGEDCEIINIPPQRLREDGIIAPAVNYVLHVDINGEMAEDPMLAARIKRSAMVAALRDFWLEHDGDDIGVRLRDKTALGFFRDRSHSAMACTAFNDNIDVEAPKFEVISGAEESADQHVKIGEMRNGTLRGLFNSRLLGEGADFPEVGAVLMPPTSSRLMAVQIGGRAVRFDPRIPRDDVRQTAIIVNTVLSVNGKVIGNPVSYWQAIQDYSIARAVVLPPIFVDDVTLLDEEQGWFESLHHEDETDVEYEAPAEPTMEQAVVAVLDAEASATIQAPEEAGPAAETETLHEEEAVEPLIEQGSIYSMEVAARRYGLKHTTNLLAAKASARRRAKDPRWLDRHGILQDLGLTLDSPRVAEVFDALDETALASSETTVAQIFGRVSVTTKIDESEGDAVILYSESSKRALARLLDLAIDPKTDEWLGRVEVVSKRWRTVETSAYFDQIEAAFLEKRRRGDDSPVVLDEALAVGMLRGRVLSRSRMKVPPTPIRMDVRAGGNGRMICYHRDDLPALSRLLAFTAQAPEKSSEWLTRKEAEKALGRRSLSTDDLFRRLEVHLVGRERAGGASDQYEIGGETIRAARRATSKTSRPICVHNDSIPAIKRILGLADIPPKTNDDLTYHEIGKHLGTNPSTNEHLRAIRDDVLRQFATSGKAFLNGQPVKAGMRRAGNGDRFYWDASCIAMFEAEITRRRQAQSDTDTTLLRRRA